MCMLYVIVVIYWFFFFKQKTAYEMRISDWSSDVCSSDLKEIGGDKFDGVKSRVIEAVGAVATPEAKQAFDELGWGNHPELIRLVNRLIDYTPQDKGERPAGDGGAASSPRPEERRVGKECGRTCRVRWSPDHYKTTHK